MQKVTVETYRNVTLNFTSQEYKDLLYILHTYKQTAADLGLDETEPTASYLADALLQTLNK